MSGRAALLVALLLAAAQADDPTCDCYCCTLAGCSVELVGGTDVSECSACDADLCSAAFPVDCDITPSTKVDTSCVASPALTTFEKWAIALGTLGVVVLCCSVCAARRSRRRRKAAEASAYAALPGQPEPMVYAGSHGVPVASGIGVPVAVPSSKAQYRSL